MDAHHTLPAELNIYGAGEQHAQLLACLAGASGDALTLAAGNVVEVDAAGLQLLIALAHECRARGMALRLQDPATTLAGAIAMLGLETFFNKAATPAGAAS